MENLEIQKTFDYSKFKLLNGNREINPSNKKRLLKSFSENYLISPISVNDKLEIIDGQHRFECAKELGLPVYYFTINDYGISEVQMLNANQKNWILDDYVNGFISVGKTDYLIYKEFRLRYKLPTAQTVSILDGMNDGGLNGTTLINRFRSGSFKVKNINDSTIMAERISSLKNYYDGYSRKAFVCAMITLLKNKNFKFDVFINKLKSNPIQLTHCTNTTNYVDLIEHIYNYRNRNKISLKY